MNAQQLLDDYGLRLPELDEERAREAEERWQRHLVEHYERWLDSDGRLELEEPGNPKTSGTTPTACPP